MTPHRSRAHLVLWSVTAAYAAGLFVVTHLPPARLPRTRVSDKIEHFAAYAVLAALLVASLRTAEVAPRLSGWLVIGICLMYGAIDELTQPLVGRFCSFDDWLADASGAIAIVAVVMVIGAMRAARLS